MNKEAAELLDRMIEFACPSHSLPDLVKLRELLTLPRQVFVLWNNECIDYSEICGAFLTEAAAKAERGGLFFDVEPVACL